MSDARKRAGEESPPPTIAEDVERELAAHIQMRAEELVAAGWRDDDARRHAERAFGDIPRISAQCRHITESMTRRHRRPRRLAEMIDTLLQDVRYALRTLSRSPGFTAIAVLTLALSIGANTAIFSVVNGVLLHPLPFADADRLVVVWEHGTRGTDVHVTWPNFVDWQESSTTLEAMAFQPTYAFGGAYTVLGGEQAVRVRAGAVSARFFEIVGVQPVVGRLPLPEEFPPAGDPVLVVSHAFWLTQLGADPDLSDRSLQVSSYELPVVAVMPPGFRFPDDTDIWLAGYGSGDSRTSHNYAVIAKLKEGATVEQADQELDAITASLKEQLGDDMYALGVNVRSLRDELVGGVERPLYMLLGAAGLVLLVACTNVASTLLARGSARRHEMAIRASLGAGRGRLVLQLLIESLILAVAGATAGLLLAQGLLGWLLAMSPDSLPRIEEIGLDATVLAFTALATLLTALLFGLLPALRGSQTRMAGALRGASRAATGERNWVWSALVSSEVALALVLLIGAGLLMLSFATVMAIDSGFDAEGVLTVDLSLPDTVYPDDASMAAFYEQLLADLTAMPGVESAGLVNHIPLGGAWINGAFRIEGRSDEDAGYGEYRVAGGDYFEAMDIALLRGRFFNAADRAGAPGVAIVNQALVDRFFPDEEPLGKRIGSLSNDGWVYGEEWLTIVGVVGNVRHDGLTAEARPETYVHYLQRPMRARGANVTLETIGEPTALVAAVREHIRRLDDRVPMDFSSMESLLGRSLAERRFTMAILAVFGAVALALAAVGIYGVVSYSVARRRREMGIRIALGAQPRGVRRLVVRRSMTLVAAGIVIGVLGALALTRLLETMLYEVSPTDPLTFAAVTLLLAATAWLASFIPALRGSRTDPMITMREQ
ncbi:MAG TPA: ABC transporter permease [Acidobacteriota bacterium]